MEQEFAGLAAEIPDSPEKRAISDSAVAFLDIAELHRSAPPMEAEAVNDPLPPGTLAPDFGLRDPSGEVVRLSDYRGRPVVLAF